MQICFGRIVSTPRKTSDSSYWLVVQSVWTQRLHLHVLLTQPKSILSPTAKIVGAEEDETLLATATAANVGPVKKQTSALNKLQLFYEHHTLGWNTSRSNHS